MKTYWVVRKKGKIVAAVLEKPGNPQQLVDDLKELAHSGKIELIMTTGKIAIGDEV